MRTEIRRIQQEAGITAVYVTHDQSEAMALSDRIILMEKGVVAQAGPPREIYYRPKSEFVADFIGEANFLRGKITGPGTAEIAGQTVSIPAKGEPGKDCTLVLRPESLSLAETGPLPCTVELSRFMGAFQEYHVRVGETAVKITDYNPRGRKIWEAGDTAAVQFAPEDAHVL